MRLSILALLTLLASSTTLVSSKKLENPAHGLASHHNEKAHYPSTFVPACHPTLDSCNSATSFCTGHGSCAEKPRALSRSSSPSTSASSNGTSSACWSCVCARTTETTKSGGKKVTEWAGTSCQKRDVSAQFLLLAGFSIVLVATVTWAVGLLISMGAEELPSVIGAGVAGPRAGAR